MLKWFGCVGRAKVMFKDNKMQLFQGEAQTLGFVITASLRPVV